MKNKIQTIRVFNFKDIESTKIKKLLQTLYFDDNNTFQPYVGLTIEDLSSSEYDNSEHMEKLRIIFKYFNKIGFNVDEYFLIFGITY